MTSTPGTLLSLTIPSGSMRSTVPTTTGQPPSGGDSAKKVELVMDLASKKWKPEDIERVLKAL